MSNRIDAYNAIWLGHIPAPFCRSIPCYHRLSIRDFCNNVFKVRFVIVNLDILEALVASHNTIDRGA
jgi:hypothetical protein